MPRKVKAAVAFKPNEPMRICEVDLADPGPNEALVRYLATGLCHTDLHVLDGSVDNEFPVILGHEGIAEVIAVGEQVTEFSPGDRVIPFLVPDCGECPMCLSGKTNFCARFAERRASNRTPFSLDGKPIGAFMAVASFAEMNVVPEDMLIKVPEAAAIEKACCIACGVTTGLGSVLKTADMQRGASVAVFGAGGVGLSVIQGAKLAGAAMIIAIDTNPEKREVAEKVGATHFIDASKTENVLAEIQKLTGHGADYTFECVGVAKLAELALEASNPFWGKSVYVGVMPTGTSLSTLSSNLALGRKWGGSFMGGAKRKDVREYVDLFVNGKLNLDHLVSHQLSHKDINHGFDMMKSGEAVRAVVIYD